MTTDRHEQARAEAERTYGHAPLGPMRSGLEAGFSHGVQWADANPKPHTITREALDEAWWATCPDGVDFVLDEFMNELGIEVTDDE